VDPGLHADLGRAELDRFVDPSDEFAFVVLVGVRRALPLSEAAERAPDDADVRHVDVPVDHERDRFAGELPGNSSAAARISSITAGRCSANNEVSSLSVSAAPSRALAIASAPCRASSLAPAAARSAPRDERPVARLDHIEHRLRDPLGIDVLGLHAERSVSA